MSESLENQVTEQLKQQGIITDEKAKAETSEGQNAQEERLLTEFEQEQQTKGWNPEGPKSAEEWARAEPLYDEIKTRGKEIKQLQRTVEQLTSHLQKTEKAAYEKAMAYLNEEKAIALQQSNVTRAKEIDQVMKEQIQPFEAPEVIQEVEDFKERHKAWLMNGLDYQARKMSEFTVKRDKELIQYNLSPAEHMKTLEEHIMKEFPEYFGSNEASKAIPAGGGEGNSTGGVIKTNTKRKFSMSDLNPEQKQVARDFERAGVMKIDEYIKQLADLGELK